MVRMMIVAALAVASLAGGAQASSGLNDGVYVARSDAPMLQSAAARRHTCVARSRTAMGYGTMPTLASAKLMALRQCAVRTPRGFVCLVVSCS